MKVLSLYDGMACGMIALKNAGIEVEKYDAYEIDKYAIKTATHNFKMIEEHGDVFDADFTQYSDVDWLIGGSPCTYWSIAQKNNRETEASGLGWELFSQYVRALHEAKPKYFVYENNKSMSKEIRASIDKAFGFEAVLINSALVSAQNRQRLYWVGERNEDGTYSKVDVEQPEDRGILLKDVLDNAVAWQYKPYAYTTRCNAAIPEDTLEKHRHTMVAEPVRIPPYGSSDKARPVCALYGNHAGTGAGSLTDRLCSDSPSKQQVDLIAEPVRVGTYPNEAKIQEHGSKQYRIYDANRKSTTLCVQCGGIGAKTWLYAIPSELNGDVPTKAINGSDGKTHPVYEVINGLITIKDKQYPIKLTDGFYIIRKLTVRECMRLQTVPDWYEFPVSNSQAYKMLGNGWTCDVITHLIKSALHDQTNT